MKVYCIECKWYQEGWCQNPKNLETKDSWASRIQMISKPWDINADNDCEWFCEKEK